MEEDLIKCLAPTFLGKFGLDGRDLRDKGINRIGNLLVPNNNYCLFEDWLMPKLDKMLADQKENVNIFITKQQQIKNQNHSHFHQYCFVLMMNYYFRECCGHLLK